MGHKIVKLTSRFKKENGSLVLILKNHYKNETLDIIKKYEDGTIYGRNIDCFNVCGWLYYSPQDKCNYYYSTQKVVGVENWFKLVCSCSLCSTASDMTIDEIDRFFEDSDFKYTFRALSDHNKLNLDMVFELYKQWKKYPKDCELLVKMGFYNLAIQKGIYRYSKENKRKMWLWLKEHQCEILKYVQYVSPQEIYMRAVKGFDDYRLYLNCEKNEQLYKYLLKQREKNNADFSTYLDYKRICVQLGKDLLDQYWLYPNDLLEAHNKVHEQLQNVLLAKEQERESVLNTIPCCKAVVNGFSLYIANSILDIRNQAEALHQCLITGKYYEKVADKKCLLIFVKKGELPIATCEIKYDKEIVQYYTDQKDFRNCTPNDELKEIMNSYIHSLKINQITKQITI